MGYFRVSSVLPILDGQFIDPPEFIGIVRYDGQFMRKCCGGNHQILGTDDVPGATQAHMPFGVNIGDSRIEWQARKQGAKCFGDLAVFVGLGGQQCTGQKFGANNCGKGDVGTRLARLACKQWGIPAAQDFNAGVGVEQEPQDVLPITSGRVPAREHPGCDPGSQGRPRKSAASLCRHR